MPTFVLNDETKVNSYGFRIPNKGIQLERFKANPVMLDSHVNSLQTILGKWKNPRIEGSLLMADTDFDSDDPTVKPVEEKVGRGFINGCSMGIDPLDWENFYKADDGVLELSPCELMEGSLCGVPSNAGSIKMYDKDGAIIPDDQIKLSIQKLSANDLSKIKNPTMEKIILSPQALSALVGVGVTSSDNVVEISNGIVALQAKLTKSEGDHTADKTKITDLQARLDKQIKLQAEALIDGAIKEGKLTADTRDADVKDAIENYELSAKMIGKIPAKTNLSGSVNNSTAAASEVKTMDDFEKLSNDKKLAFKAENPEAYKLLFSK